MSEEVNFEINVILPEIPGIPKNEMLWVQEYDEKGEIHHVITSTKTRDRYFLYLNERGQLVKKLKAASPEKFAKYI